MLRIVPLVAVAAACFAEPRETEVRVRPTAAGPQIHVDGKPVPPRFFFYWAGSRSSETNAATLRTVANAGVELIEVGIAHSFLSPKRERVRWTAFEGPDDWSIADDQVRKAIEAHPNGKFLLRVFVNAPKAVLESNPDWCMRFEDDDDVKGERMASPSCRPYRETRLQVNRAREESRFEIVFPDGKVEATSGSERAKATEAIQVPHYVWRTSAASGRVIIDLCGSTVIANPTHNSQLTTHNSGIIDFWAEDAVDMPRDPTGNFIPNGSFEQGLAYWSFDWGGTSWNDVAVTGGPLEYITDEAKVGDKALCMRASKTRGGYEPLRSAGMSIEPGVPHVLSAWVKRAAGEEGTAKITIKAQNTHKLGRVTNPHGEAATKSVTLADNEWRFVEIPFTSVLGDCLVYLSGSGAAALVDGVRVERVVSSDRINKIDRISESCKSCKSCLKKLVVEARLETASEENIVNWGTPIDARLVLSGADGAEGTVRVSVRNFYNETVYDKTLPFVLPKDKVLPLDFDTEKLGTGVFVLGTEFVIENNLDNSKQLSEDRRATARRDAGQYRSPYQRFAILKPLEGKHETANFYVQFPYYERGSNGEKLARYAKAIGITTTTWERNSAFADTNAPTAQLRRKYGITARLHCVSSELAQKYPDRFGPGKEGLKAFTNAVPEQIAFIEKEAYLAGLGAVGGAADFMVQF